MAKRRRHRRSVALPEFTDLGPLVVRPVYNLDQLEEMSRSQTAFGGGMRGRLLPEKVGGKRGLTVMVLYTSSRARVAVLDPAIAKRFQSKVRWLWMFNRVVSFDVLVDGDPKSPTYLQLTLNPAVESAPVRDLSA